MVCYVGYEFTTEKDETEMTISENVKMYELTRLTTLEPFVLDGSKFFHEQISQFVPLVGIPLHVS
jgi:hypothetical protein